MEALNNPTILTILLGLLQSVGIIVAGLTINRKRMIIIYIVAGIISFSQHTLLGALFAATMSIAGMLRNLIAYGGLRYKWMNSPWLLIVFLANIAIPWILIRDWTNPPTILEIVALISPLLAQSALFFKHIIYVKFTLIIAGTTWLIYLSSLQAWGQIIGEAFSIIANSLAIATILIKRGEGVKTEDINDLTLTDTINTLTGAIAIIKTETIPIVKDPEEK